MQHQAHVTTCVQVWAQVRGANWGTGRASLEEREQGLGAGYREGEVVWRAKRFPGKGDHKLGSSDRGCIGRQTMGDLATRGENGWRQCHHHGMVGVGAKELEEVRGVLESERVTEQSQVAEGTEQLGGCDQVTQRQKQRPGMHGAVLTGGIRAKNVSTRSPKWQRLGQWYR